MVILQDIFPDKAMERKILSLAVKCPSDGCEWTGELRYKEVKLTSWSYSHWKVNNLVMKTGTNSRTNWTHKMYCQCFTKRWISSDFNHVTICIVLELWLKGFLLSNRATCHLVLSNLCLALTKIVKQLWHGKMLKNMSRFCANGGLYCVVTAVRHIQNALMRYSTLTNEHF